MTEQQYIVDNLESNMERVRERKQSLSFFDPRRFSLEESVIKCQNPRIIVNPAIWRHLYHSRVYWIFGQQKHMSDNYFHSRLFVDKLLRSCQKHVTQWNISQCYTVSRYGEVIPLYMTVPCGHCSLCREAKRQRLCNRITAEYLSHSVKPLFLTLTYNDDNLPFDNQPSVRHCQLFLKRLRKWLSDNNYSEKIRFILISEHGKKRGRVHYHAIIFGLPLRPEYQWKDTISDLWSNGFVYVEYADNNVGSYVTKYITKNSYRSKNKELMLYSRRPGLGAFFIDKHLDYVKKNPKIEYLEATDPFSSKILKVYFSRYFIDRIFKTYRSVIPCKEQLQIAYYQLRKRHSAFSLLSPLSQTQISDIIEKKGTWLRKKIVNECIEVVKDVKSSWETYVPDNQRIALANQYDISRQQFLSLHSATCDTYNIPILLSTLKSRLAKIKETDNQ